MKRIIELVLLIAGLITFTMGAVSDMFNIQLSKPYFEYIISGYFLFILALLFGIARNLDESKLKSD